MGIGTRQGILWLAAWALVMAAPLRADSESDRRIENAARSTYNFRVVLADEVGVEVESGVVTLSGTVLDRHQKALAEDTVRSLPGVAEVRNHLDIAAPGRERSDGWLELKIRGNFLLNPDVSVTKTEVSVRDGVVTLSGTADSLVQKEAAETHARNVEGVRAVRNEIQLAPSRQQAAAAPAGTAGENDRDRALTERVRKALNTHEGTRSLNPQIVTRNREVIIRGTAPSDAERLLVSRIARAVEGVESVTNHMISASE